MPFDHLPRCRPAPQDKELSRGNNLPSHLTAVDREDDAEPSQVRPGWRRCKSDHPSGAPILKPCKPSCRLGLAPEPLKDVPRLAQPGRVRRAHLGPVRIPPGELGLDQRPDVDPVDGHVHDLAVDVDVDELGTASPRGSCRRRGTGRHSGRWPRTASR